MDPEIPGNTRRKPLRIYLAGAIEAAPDGGRGWREKIKPVLIERFKVNYYDPADSAHNVLTTEEKKYFRTWRRSEPEAFRRAITKIIANDLKRILFKTDLILCHWDEYVKEGGGTQGELTVARLFDIPVILWTSIPRERVSSWILGCSTWICESVEEVEKVLEREIPRLKRRDSFPKLAPLFRIDNA